MLRAAKVTLLAYSIFPEMITSGGPAWQRFDSVLSSILQFGQAHGTRGIGVVYRAFRLLRDTGQPLNFETFHSAVDNIEWANDNYRAVLREVQGRCELDHGIRKKLKKAPPAWGQGEKDDVHNECRDGIVTYLQSVAGELSRDEPARQDQRERVAQVTLIVRAVGLELPQDQTGVDDDWTRLMVSLMLPGGTHVDLKLWLVHDALSRLKQESKHGVHVNLAEFERVVEIIKNGGVRPS